MPTPTSESRFFKRALHRYVDIHTDIYICEVLYQNTIFELSIGIARSSSGMAFNALRKRALHMSNVEINALRKIVLLQLVQKKWTLSQFGGIC